MFLIQSNFGNVGNFELLFLEQNKLVHYFRDNDDPIRPWYIGGVFGENVSSIPAFIQSTYGNIGNFEVVVKEGNQLRHYWRDNDIPGNLWHKGAIFGSNVNSSPTMIQSNLDNIGNFEVIVREGDKLRHYWRDNNAPDYPWYRGNLFGNNVSSEPVMIQSTLGNIGNFEVVVREGDKLRHYWRNNDITDYPWQKGNLFGNNITSSPTLIQSTFGNTGNFEIIVKENNSLKHYYKDNDSKNDWIKGVLFSDRITYNVSLIQGNIGNIGNFELLTRRGNSIVHFFRDNNKVGLPWSDEYPIHAVVPAGIPPTATQKMTFDELFPDLRNWYITAPKTPIYNCISWSLSITNEWLWPGNTVAAFDEFYALYGWFPSPNGSREYRKRKIALLADEFGCTHASLETYNADWHESKCGKLEQIIHDKYQLQNGLYGYIIKYYEKEDPNANLDLR